MSLKLPTTPQAVAAWLPHRAPMLLIDKVLEADNDHLVAERTFTAAEVFFQGHFPPPDAPVLPGVILLEAMAQAAALHSALTKNYPNGAAIYRFSSAEQVVWSAPVLPGQTVQLRVKKLREKLGFFVFSGMAEVAGAVCCEAKFMAKVTPR